MKILNVIIFTISFLVIGNSFSQKLDKWSVSLGVNVIDNNGKVKSDFFKVKSDWNCLPFPSTLNVGYKYNDYFTFEFSEAINSFEKWKRINGEKVDKTHFVTSTTLNGKFHLNSLYNPSSKLDLYAGGGFGVTTIRNTVLLQPTLAAGFNYWITEGVAINCQAGAFFGITQVKNNFLMYTTTLKVMLPKL